MITASPLKQAPVSRAGPSPSRCLAAWQPWPLETSEPGSCQCIPLTYPFLIAEYTDCSGALLQSCAFSWIPCHLAASRPLCKTARSLLIWCQYQRAWNSASVFRIFPSRLPPPSAVSFMSPFTVPYPHNLFQVQDSSDSSSTPPCPPYPGDQEVKLPHSGRGWQSGRGSD